MASHLVVHISQYEYLALRTSSLSLLPDALAAPAQDRLVCAHSTLFSQTSGDRPLKRLAAPLALGYSLNTADARSVRHYPRAVCERIANAQSIRAFATCRAPGFDRKRGDPTRSSRRLEARLHLLTRTGHGCARRVSQPPGSSSVLLASLTVRRARPAHALLLVGTTCSLRPQVRAAHVLNTVYFILCPPSLCATWSPQYISTPTRSCKATQAVSTGPALECAFHLPALRRVRSMPEGTRVSSLRVREGGAGVCLLGQQAKSSGVLDSVR
ncbi:uncharacterized protein LAESUDRAFT_758528 [Laetiporus sulphureus 93-53]|uniref:Uncharacterized protein n=1 Tax=Laetiporus sulphureus 93-53 TaxID=1314785 RepID=A0A165EPY5_9APHY|nr:uncharacterized protein LAESUDRAFT_758528 [Laetiporus sulphureus 93-53]KZT07520.1 hypothetical protein LAESUDRAFT_758528 [Laetiporus sulphureus 93-53]